MPTATRPAVPQQESEQTFERLVREGNQRLGRSGWGQVATGLLGGLDVGTGVLALLLVEHETHNPLLAGLAFSIGFVALSLARSELFTENFLVPVTAVVAREAGLVALLRMWGVSLATNLLGGWVITGLVMLGFPQLHDTAREAAGFYIGLGVSGKAFALALLGGFVITLMTHMQHATDSDGVKLVPSVAMGFLLGAGKLDHAIVASLVTFSALHAGAAFGYVDWLGLLGFAVLGNMVGGLGLVTVLRLLQVPDKVADKRRS
ncbi:MAG: formate/nitrite transporter family protein [Mycobacteriales bacterium]